MGDTKAVPSARAGDAAGSNGGPMTRRCDIPPPPRSGRIPIEAPGHKATVKSPVEYSPAIARRRATLQASIMVETT